MPMDNIILICYAVFLLIGALMGFRAGSKVSLIMGFVSGALVLLGVYLIGGNPKFGWSFLSGVNGLLTVVFISRLFKTRKIMPSGILLLASLLVTGFCLTRLMNLH